MKHDQILLTVMGMIVIGFIITHPSMNRAQQKSDVEAIDHTVSAVHQGMIMVDRVALKYLIEDAKRQGADLNVAIYEYDKKMEVWNRAEKWCK